MQIYTKTCFSVVEVSKVEYEKSYWILALKVNMSGKTFLIICLYRSPNCSTNDYLCFFESWCNEVICETSVPVLMVGDFNLNWFSSDTYAQKLKDITCDVGLQQIINEITRPNGYGGTLIDLVLTSQTDIIKKTKVLHTPRISDHYMVSVEFNFFTNKVQPYIIKTRGNNIDYKTINNQLQNVNWNYHIRDVDLKCRMLLETIKQIFDSVAPVKEIKILPRFKPWWNERVKEAARMRDESYRKCVILKTDVSYKKYKEARNCVVSVIRQEKRRYFQEKVDESKNDSSKMWDALKLILDSNKNFQKIKEIHFNDDIVNSESKLPSRLNAYYISSIEEIITGINYININANVNKELAGVSTLSCFTMIDESILKNIIFSLENKNSPDEINDKLLKNIYPTIEKPLINLINSSLEQGIFPDVLKMSTVIPIQKKENAVNASDLRPINTLPIIEKILEKVVYAQLLEFIVKNNIISKHQSGFRKGHSCETAIQCVLDDWKNWADDGYSVMAVFLDLQRAFETIDRKKLLSKLEFIGIRGNVKKWFQSYLNNRMQCVKLNGFTSNEILNEYGVPQGSVLGPILFVLYINDMVDIMDNVSIHLFADDTLIYYYSKDLDQLVHCINNSLEKIHNYTCSNLLKINAKKTKFMLISKERVKEEFVANSYKIEINNEQIEQVKKIKYLGVIIDDKLLFKEHCNYMVSKISYAINYMSRCSSTLSVWSRKIIFNTLILPHFNYCATIMYLFQQNEIGRLQKLQNRAMRIILSCNRYASINTMLSSLQWLPVSLYIKYNVLVFIFKVKTGSAPSYLTSKLTYNNEIHQYNTRQQNNFFIPPRNKKIGTNSVFHKGLNDFNKLPNTIKDCSSILTFKKELKMYLLREAYLYQG